MRHKRTVCAILIAIIFFSLFSLLSFESASQYTVIDSYNRKVYNVACDNEVCISDNSTEYRFFIDSEIVDICCVDSKFTFLCITETTQNSFVYVIYTYNLNNSALTSYATDCKATKSNCIFTANGNNTVYIGDYYNQTLLHCYSNGVKSDVISCNAQIKQLICVGYNDVLLFTVDGVYLLTEDVPIKIYNYVPVTPCIYSGNGIIIDNSGESYLYKNSTFELYTPKDDDREITVDYDNEYLLIQQGQTFATLYKFLYLDKSELTVKKQDGNYITEGKLGTGMTAQFKGMTYKIAVYGDITGEGNVNSRDLKALMEHLSGKTPLSDIYFTAADIDKDGILSTKDLLALSMLY